MLKDIVGKELNPGDMIAYPRRSGSHLSMTTAKILEIKENSIAMAPTPSTQSKPKKKTGL